MGDIYRHKTSGKEYILISTKFRYKDEHGWHDAYLYQPRYASDYEYFAKSKTVFNKEFEKCEWVESEYQPVTQNETLLESIVSPYVNSEKLKNCSTYKIYGSDLMYAAFTGTLQIEHAGMFDMGEYAQVKYKNFMTYMVSVSTEDNIVVDIYEYSDDMFDTLD